MVYRVYGLRSFCLRNSRVVRGAGGEETRILPERPTDLQSVQLQVGDADGSHGRDWSRLGA